MSKTRRRTTVVLVLLAVVAVLIGWKVYEDHKPPRLFETSVDESGGIHIKNGDAPFDVIDLPDGTGLSAYCASYDDSASPDDDWIQAVDVLVDGRDGILVEVSPGSLLKVPRKALPDCEGFDRLQFYGGHWKFYGQLMEPQ